MTERITAHSPVTGDLIKSRADGQEAYAQGWDAIFGKKAIVPTKEETLIRKYRIPKELYRHANLWIAWNDEFIKKYSGEPEGCDSWEESEWGLLEIEYKTYVKGLEKYEVT